MNIQEILENDRRLRPQTNHVQLADQIGALFDDQASSLTIQHLKQMGAGNPKIASTNVPIVAGLLSRVIDTLAVLYTTPATRLLRGATDEEQEQWDEVQDISAYDDAWTAIEVATALWEQCVVVASEDRDHGCARFQVFGPHRVFRSGGSGGASLFDVDHLVLHTHGPTLIGGALPAASNMDDDPHRFEVWSFDQDSERYLFSVWNSSGQIGETEDLGYERLPALLIQSRYSNQAWLPIRESRRNFALSVNALLNDIAFLVSMEAHTHLALTSDSGSPPTVAGPGHVTQLASDEKIEAIHTSPKIAESIEALEALIQSWASSESIPVESLLRKRGDMTGDAILASERDLEARRIKRRASAVRNERLAFEIFARVHNAISSQIIPDDLPLTVILGRTWRAKSPQEKQQILYREMAAGLASSIDYVQQMHGVSRREAIEIYHQTQLDRTQYPLQSAQSPGSIIGDDGPRAALGDGSASDSTRGVFRADVETMTEGASVTEAAMKGAS